MEGKEEKRWRAKERRMRAKRRREQGARVPGPGLGGGQGQRGEDGADEDDRRARVKRRGEERRARVRMKRRGEA